jgi:hypothetical protein
MTLGPFFDDAPSLRATVRHAERFAALLHRTRPRPPDCLAAAWLCGRAEEIDVYVQIVGRAWRFEEVSDKDAAARLARYLDELHAGYRTYYGRGALECCDDSMGTAPTADYPAAAAASPVASSS